jgi:hypothetical protein
MSLASSSRRNVAELTKPAKPIYLGGAVLPVFGIEVSLVEEAVLPYHVGQGGDPVLVVLPPAADVGGRILP